MFICKESTYNKSVKRFMYIVVSLFIFTLPQNIWSQTMETNSKERIENLTKAMDEYPDLFTQEMRETILQGKVILGMSRYQAQLAGGSCSFAVSADPEKWKPNSNPFRVIQAQTYHPDNSEIRLTFQNDTQYPNEGVQTFHVDFRQGKATNIEKHIKVKND